LCNLEDGWFVGEESGFYRFFDKATSPRCFNDMFNASSNFRDAGEISMAVKGRVLDVFFPLDECDDLLRQRFIQNSSARLLT